MNFRDIFFNHREDWLIQKINLIFFTDNIISKSIAIFNHVFLYLFLFLLFIMIVSAALNAAAQGRALGKGSDVWVIIRVLMGLFLIFPIGTQQYNTAQHLALKAIEIGSRGATYAWEKALEQMRDLKPLVPPSPPKVSAFVHKLFSMSVCIETQNHPESPQPRITETLHEFKDRYVLSADGDPAQGGIPAQCGSIAYLKADVDSAQAREILRQHVVLTNKLRKDLSQVTKGLVAYWFPLTPKGDLPRKNVNTLLSSYLNGIAKMAPAKLLPSLEKRDTFFNETKRGGWAFAGSWALQLSAVNSTVYSALDALPTVTPPKYEWWSGDLYNHHHWIFDAAEKWWNENDLVGRTIHEESYTTFKEDSFLALIDVARMKLFYDTILIQGDDLNPMDKMISLGHAIVNVVWGSIGAKALMDATLEGAKQASDSQVISWFANKVSGLPIALTSGAQAAFNAYAPMFYLGIFALLAGGITLAYILPLTPFRLWLFAIARYFTRAVMAILAAPLWALSHLEMEGTGFGRRASHGYYVLLDLLIRPLIMVIGLLAGFLLITLLSELFTMTFHTAVMNALSGSHGGITGLVVYTIFGAVIFVTLVTIAFSTISDGIEFMFETAGYRTPHGGGNPERDLQALDGRIDHSGQKVEGVVKQGASDFGSSSPKPISANQLIDPSRK